MISKSTGQCINKKWTDVWFRLWFGTSDRQQTIGKDVFTCFLFLTQHHSSYARLAPRPLTSSFTRECWLFAHTHAHSLRARVATKVEWAHGNNNPTWLLSKQLWWPDFASGLFVAFKVTRLFLSPSTHGTVFCFTGLLILATAWSFYPGPDWCTKNVVGQTNEFRVEAGVGVWREEVLLLLSVLSRSSRLTYSCATKNHVSSTCCFAAFEWNKCPFYVEIFMFKNA